MIAPLDLQSQRHNSGGTTVLCGYAKTLHCRYKELQLSPLQIAGAGISVVAAVTLYGAMELWRYNSDVTQFPH